MSDYKLTVGLEVHAELNTHSKMFCGCPNNPDETAPNVFVCPVCMAHPGTLPVINKEAVKSVLKIGTAVGGNLADFTEFDRKNYFYPDIPKGYQISQYKYPLVSGGKIHGVELTRIHLEEDTATSIHDRGAFSLVNYNRAGVPLMELVTEPVIHSPEEASAFARELQLLLQYTGVGEANMEKGEMRVEANISVSKVDGVFGTKVEVKNLNSFKVVEKAIAYEMKRHIKLIDKGEVVVQETRGWDENKQETFSQRKKESSHDYRYFPDPDLPKLKISEIPEFSKENLEKELPELPWEKRVRYKMSFNLKDEDAELYVLNPRWAIYFEEVLKTIDEKDIKLASNYLTSDLAGLIKKDEARWNSSPIIASDFAELIKLVGANKVSSRGAKDILAIMYAEGGTPDAIATTKDLFQKSDTGELTKIVTQIIVDNQKAVDEYKAGKEASLQFLIGQGMKLTKGSANPGLLKELFLKVITG